MADEADTMFRAATVAAWALSQNLLGALVRRGALGREDARAVIDAALHALDPSVDAAAPEFGFAQAMLTRCLDEVLQMPPPAG